MNLAALSDIHAWMTGERPLTANGFSPDFGPLGGLSFEVPRDYPIYCGFDAAALCWGSDLTAEELPFNNPAFRHRCWLVSFDGPNQEWCLETFRIYDRARRILGLDEIQARELMAPTDCIEGPDEALYHDRWGGWWEVSETSTEWAAAVLKHLIDTGKVDWSVGRPVVTG